MPALAQDLLYGLRQLRRNPFATFIAVVALAFGVGANSALFCILDPLLLRKLPVNNPDELVYIDSMGSLGRAEISELSAFREYRDKCRGFSSVFAFAPITDCKAEHNSSKRTARCEAVSGNYFSGLGVHPFLGRFIASSDADNPVAVMSWNYWKSAFGADPAAIGRTISLNNVLYTIIGVAPAEFFGCEAGKSPDIYHPINSRRGQDSWVQIIGRLKPGVSREQAQAGLAPVFQQVIKNSPVPEVEKEQVMARLTVEPASRGLSELRARFSTPSRILIGVVGLILLVTCTNVANLRMVQGIARKKEFCVRQALGAGRWRILRQLFIEGLLLVSLAAAGGLLLAAWMSSHLISAVSTEKISIVLRAGVTPRVLLFTAAVAAFTVLLSNVAPTLLVMRFSNLATNLRMQGPDQSGQHSSRIGDILITAQIALSTVLLVCSGLLLHSLVGLETFDTGFNRKHVLIASVEQNTPGRSPEQIKAFFNEVRQRAGNLPGILSAGYSSFTPISGSQLGVNVVVEDRPFKAGENGHTLFAGVSPDYFRTLGIPLLQGRDFTAQEIQSFPPSVAIINRTMALRYFGNVSPVGRHLRIVEGSFPPLEIIGIAADSKYNDLREATQNFFYLPSSQGKTLMFRTSSDPDVFIQPIRELIASIDTAVTIVSIKRLRDQVGESYRMDKVVTVLCSGFGVLALLLSCLGLYGILSFSVERRRKEIALRMALGATRESVLRLVVLKGMGLTLLGFAIGLPAAIAAVSILKGFLFGIGRFDIWTVVPVSILLLVSSFLACYRPARHAASLDPNDVLRME